MEGAVSSTPDTGAVTTGPTSFSDPSLTWTEDSSASTPSSDGSPAVTPSADATAPPAADAPTDGQPPASGEPPRERWDTILANARAKAADEALAPYAWAKQVNPQEFQQVQQFAKHFAGGDFMSGLQSLIAEGRKDPTVDAQIRSFHARELSRRQQAPPEAQTEPQPDLPIQLEDGRVVHLYSAEQQAKREAYLQQKWDQKLDQKIQPFQQTHEQLQAERQAAARQQQINHFVTSTEQDVRTWPHMDKPEHVAALQQELAKFPDTDDPREVLLQTNRAYRAVMANVVLPALSRTAEAKQLDSLQRKAAASTSVNPGSAAASSPRVVHRFSDLGPEAWK